MSFALSLEIADALLPKSQQTLQVVRLGERQFLLSDDLDESSRSYFLSGLDTQESFPLVLRFPPSERAGKSSRLDFRVCENFLVELFRESEEGNSRNLQLVVFDLQSEDKVRNTIFYQQIYNIFA